MFRGWLAVTVLVALVGCGVPDGSVATTPLIAYGRNAAVGIAWFAIRPVTDPIQSVGFGPDLGAACLLAPLGSELVRLDRAPGPGSNVISVVARIEPATEGQRPLELWVDVARDGSVTTGRGMPAWWADDPPTC